ncbi:MAG: hypothetical protein JXA19_00465 [Anaerolineales bacterium]|nr:hypothetical protein [Anaerolineales bacterium]
MDFLLSPPVALIIYMVLVGILLLIGKRLAGPEDATPDKLSTYSSGEAPPSKIAAPGYKPFFIVALFFAILHLGVLVMGSTDLSPFSIVYLVGIALALIALMYG